jgi:hypothetical protein
LHCNIVWHASISYRNELMFLVSRILENVSCCTRIFDIFLFLVFFKNLVLVQIRRIYCILNIASYHYYFYAKIHLYQDYFNMSCNWHMIMCCLIRPPVNMLTLLKILLTKELMPMEKVKTKNAFAFSMWKQPWYSHFNTMHGT